MKIREFLKDERTITNGEVLTQIGCTLILGAMAFVLNEKLYKTRIRNIDLKWDKEKLEKKLEELEALKTNETEEPNIEE